MAETDRSFPTLDAYYRPKQAAYLMGMSVRSLYRRLHGEDAPPFKRRGKLFLMPRQEFDEWVSREVIE